VLLTATIQGAASATLEPGFGTPGTIDPGGGVFPVVVTEPTTFVLTVTNPSGTVTDQVEVTPRPPSAQLTASSYHVSGGDDVELNAVIQGADTATLEPGFGEIDPTGGVFTATILETTTFVVTATNSAGTTTAQTTVQAYPPRIVSFSTNRSQILVEETANLSWEVTGATLITIEPVGYTTTAATGMLVVDPDVTTVYTLTASNPAGSVSEQIGIEVLPFVIVDFSADQQIIEAGESVTLAWEVVGDANVTLDDEPVPAVGTTVVRPTATTTYRLQATNGSLTQTRSVVVSVRIPGAGALYFSWSDSEYPGTSPGLQVGIPFDVHVLAIDPADGLAGFELGLGIPPCVIALASVLPSPGGINLGTGPYNWIVGTGECLQDVIVPLLRITFIVLSEHCFLDAELSFGPATPSSFIPPAPGYLTCTEELVPFEVGPNLSLEHEPYIPVLMDLTAAGQPEGVRLIWDLTGWDYAYSSATRSPWSELAMLRRQDDGTVGAPSEAYQTIERLTGAEASPRGDWLDTTARPGVHYRYLLRAKLNGELGDALDGVVLTSGEVRAVRPGSAATRRTRLLPNQPNPFRLVTDLRFHLLESSDATLHVFDVSGRRIRTLRRAALPPGEHHVSWDGLDAHGTPVSSGVYVVRLETNRAVDTRRITLMR
jgi:hypothetical protein